MKKPKHPLTTRTKNICGFVTFKDYELFEVEEFSDEFVRFFKSCASMYALNTHMLDVNELGELESPHIHYVAILNKVTRLSTVLNSISKALGVNTFAVTIDKCDTLNGAIRYLCHVDDFDKVQYCAYLVKTSMAFDELRAIFNADNQSSLTSDRLLEIIDNATSKRDILKEIGVYQYRNLRGVINDLWQEREKCYGRTRKNETSATA